MRFVIKTSFSVAICLLTLAQRRHGLRCTKREVIKRLGFKTTGMDVDTFEFT